MGDTRVRMDVSEIEIDPDADVSASKFMALYKDKGFAALWGRKVKGMSAEEVDEGLVVNAAEAGWDDQEIVNLVLSNHREVGITIKSPDYYHKVLQVAHSHRNRADASQKLKSGSVDRAEGLAYLSGELKVNILSIVKHKASNPTYWIKTDVADILVGHADQLITQSKLRIHLAAAAGVMMPTFKNKEWERIAQALLDVCVEDDIGPEATERGQIEMWLDKYLYDFPPTEDIDDNGTDATWLGPDGSTYIQGPSFRSWVFRAFGDKMSPPQLGHLMRVIGAVPERRNIRVNGQITTRYLWRLPDRTVKIDASS
jgi:hypothetical protein